MPIIVVKNGDNDHSLVKKLDLVIKGNKGQAALLAEDLASELETQAPETSEASSLREIAEFKVYKVSKPSFIDNSVKTRLVGEDVYYKDEHSLADLQALQSDTGAKPTARAPNQPSLLQKFRAFRSMHPARVNNSHHSLLTSLRSDEERFKMIKAGQKLALHVEGPTIEGTLKWAVAYVSSNEQILLHLFSEISAKIGAHEQGLQSKKPDDSSPVRQQPSTKGRSTSTSPFARPHASQQATESLAGTKATTTSATSTSTSKGVPLAQQLEALKLAGTEQFLRMICADASALNSRGLSSRHTTSRQSTNSMGDPSRPNQPRRSAARPTGGRASRVRAADSEASSLVAETSTAPALSESSENDMDESRFAVGGGGLSQPFHLLSVEDEDGREERELPLIPEKVFEQGEGPGPERPRTHEASDAEENSLQPSLHTAEASGLRFASPPSSSQRTAAPRSANPKAQQASKAAKVTASLCMQGSGQASPVKATSRQPSPRKGKEGQGELREPEPYKPRSPPSSSSAATRAVSTSRSRSRSPTHPLPSKQPSTHASLETQPQRTVKYGRVGGHSFGDKTDLDNNEGVLVYEQLRRSQALFLKSMAFTLDIFKKTAERYQHLQDKAQRKLRRVHHHGHQLLSECEAAAQVHHQAAQQAEQVWEEKHFHRASVLAVKFPILTAEALPMEEGASPRSSPRGSRAAREELRLRRQAAQQALEGTHVRLLCEVKWFVQVTSRLREHLRRMNNIAPASCLKFVIILQALLCLQLTVTVEVFYRVLLSPEVFTEEDFRKNIVHQVIDVVRCGLGITAETFVEFLEAHGFQPSPELLNEIRVLQQSRVQATSGKSKGVVATPRVRGEETVAATVVMFDVPELGLTSKVGVLSADG